MSFEKAKNHLEKYGFGDRVRTFDTSSATVALAAQALGCDEAHIAKTLSFAVSEERTVLIVTAGDTKVNNGKFKSFFGVKAKMLSFEEVEAKIGHAVGGVCPFGVNDGVEVYLDESMKRFEKIFPACGSGNSAVELTIEELEKCSEYKAWVDVVVLLGE